MSSGNMDPRSVAIVTGATRGLGFQVGRDLAAAGLDVAACARTPTAPAFGEKLYRPVDVANVAAVGDFVAATVSQFGRVDALVNNAGFVNRAALVSETDDLTVAKCFATNLFGPIAFMKHVLPIMRRQAEGGVIVNVASRAGITPVPGLAAYSASKSALVSFTLAAAKELPETRVLCISLCPAGMNTGLRAAAYGTEDAATRLDPHAISRYVVEAVTHRTVNGKGLASGEAVIVDSEGKARVLDWPRDERGFQGLQLG